MFSLAVGIITLAAAFASAQNTGTTTRYWDCCKTSCAWSGKASVSAPVRTCDRSNNPLSDPDVSSGCDGGTAFACANNSPWAVDDNTAYGFAAVNIAGQTEANWCCQCYELTFTSTAISGKRMIIQATNTGGDLSGNQFDLMIPGGGVGIFNGCTPQYGSWNGGAQYGGVSSRDQCSNVPAPVQAGCRFRFDWFQGADNPTVRWTTVACPSQLTSITGCSRR